MRSRFSLVVFAILVVFVGTAQWAQADDPAPYIQLGESFQLTDELARQFRDLLPRAIAGTTTEDHGWLVKLYPGLARIERSGEWFAIVDLRKPTGDRPVWTYHLGRQCIGGPDLRQVPTEVQVRGLLKLVRRCVQTIKPRTTIAPTPTQSVRVPAPVQVDQCQAQSHAASAATSVSIATSSPTTATSQSGSQSGLQAGPPPGGWQLSEELVHLAPAVWQPLERLLTMYAARPRCPEHQLVHLDERTTLHTQKDPFAEQILTIIHVLRSDGSVDSIGYSPLGHRVMGVRYVHVVTRGIEIRAVLTIKPAELAKIMPMLVRHLAKFEQAPVPDSDAYDVKLPEPSSGNTHDTVGP